MANSKQRYINTKFWNDTYISELDPIEKLLFIYFLTNEHTNISGIYEIPLKIIGIETGIDSSMLKKILPRLEHKIRYIDGMVVIKNFVKHQENKSPQVKVGIVNQLKEIDQDFLKNVVNKGYYELDRYYIDTLSIPYTYDSSYLDLDSDSNSNLDANAKEVSEIIKAFEKVDAKNKTYYGNKTQRKAVEFLITEYGFDKVLKVIDILPKSNNLDYCPVITSPYDLKEKWAKLATSLQKIKNNQTITL